MQVNAVNPAANPAGAQFDTTAIFLPSGLLRIGGQGINTNVLSKSYKRPLALSLSPLGGERVAEGRVRDICTGLKANQYK